MYGRVCSSSNWCVESSSFWNVSSCCVVHSQSPAVWSVAGVHRGKLGQQEMSMSSAGNAEKGVCQTENARQRLYLGLITL